MTPNPVASAPKEIAPQRAAPPLPGVGTAFDQLLSLGHVPPKPRSTQAGQPDAAHATAPSKAKNAGDAANAAAAAPAPAPQLLSAISVATSSGEATVAAPAAPAPFAIKPPDAPALGDLPGASTAASADAGANGGPATLPPGAAELDARIVAAAPNYLSQPNAALAGLWHHLGPSPSATTPGQPGEPPAGSADAASDGAPATPAQTAAAKDAAALAKDLSLQSHATPAIETTQATVADPGKASAAASSGADASAAATIALPGAADAQLAATPAATASPTLASATQIPTAWEQVAVNLGPAARSGNDRIEIQLKPASLGAIAVKLDLTHDGRITAVISADRSDTLNLLRQHSDALTQSLRDAGLQADAGSLSFNLRGDPQSFAQAPAPTGNDANPVDAPAATSSLSAEAGRYRRHAGALDIEV